MPDCYLCGAYIERGRGYRRHVEIETSTRVYVTRHGGGSLGTRSALRTLCAACATVTDRTHSGLWLRSAVYVLGFMASMYVGWQIILRGGGGAATVVGLVFLFGLPAVALAHAYEAIRKSQILTEVGSGDDDYEPSEPEHDAAGQDLSLFEWADQIVIAASRRGNKDPRVAKLKLFRSDDSILDWSERNAAILSRSDASDFDHFLCTLVSLAKAVRPRAGEGPAEFARRASARIASLMAAQENDPASQLRREGETVEDWLKRTMPLFWRMKNGQSFEDLIPSLVAVAETLPPDRDEEADVWLARVMEALESVGVEF